MNGFKCCDEVMYGQHPAIIMGKRYGNATDPKVGRMYDIKIGSRILRDIPEDDLQLPEKTLVFLELVKHE